jgi:hypothetical protein
MSKNPERSVVLCPSIPLYVVRSSRVQLSLSVPFPWSGTSNFVCSSLSTVLPSRTRANESLFRTLVPTRSTRERKSADTEKHTPSGLNRKPVPTKPRTPPHKAPDPPQEDFNEEEWNSSIGSNWPCLRCHQSGSSKSSRTSRILTFVNPTLRERGAQGIG